MNLEVFKRKGKFFLRDTESGEVVGSAKGYSTEDEAKKAMKDISMSSKLPKPQPKAVADVPASPILGAAMPPMPGMGGGMGGLGDLLGKMGGM